MHIGITGPVSLEPLLPFFQERPALPPTYSFPLIGLLAKNLLDHGHQVTVFAESTEVCSPECFKGKDLVIWVSPLRKRKAVYDFYKKERALLTPLMKQSGCDVIHAHWTYEFAAAALASGIPTLVTAHDSPWTILRYFLRGKAALFWFFRVLLAVRVMRSASMLTTVSEYCKKEIERTIRPGAPFFVVPNAVQEELLAMGKERLETWGRATASPVVAVISEGFTERKNTKNALRAFHLFHQKLQGARLVVFGTGHEKNGVAHAWASANGLEEGVEFYGKLSPADLFQKLVAEVDFLLHPSREESFGMAPLEAMALGIPVVAGYRSGAVPQVVGDAGSLVDINKPKWIAQALINLTDTPRCYAHLARRGHERAIACFSMENMVGQYLDLYRKLLRLR